MPSRQIMHKRSEANALHNPANFNPLPAQRCIPHSKTPDVWPPILRQPIWKRHPTRHLVRHIPQPVWNFRNRSHGIRVFCGDVRGQAHFSAMTFRTKYAHTRRKMSQTPSC